MKTQNKISRSMYPKTTGLQRQKGVVALAISLILLLLVTIGTLYVARTVTTEQRISANDTRSKSAFEAAEAGRNFVITFMNIEDPDARSDQLEHLGINDDFDDDPNNDIPDNIDYDDCDKNNDNDCSSADPAVDDEGNATNEADPAVNKGYFIQAIWDPDNNEFVYSLPSNPDSCDTTVDDVNVRICLQIKMGENTYTADLTAWGFSDDQSAEKVITQTLRVGAPFDGGTVTHPLIAFGSIQVGGSMTVVNVFSNATIWCGGDVEGFGNGASDQRGTLIHPNPDGPQVANVDGWLTPFYDEPPFNNQMDPGEELLDIEANKYLLSDVTKSSGGTGADTYLGPDVIDDSEDLRMSKTPDPDGFFKNFFPGSPDYYKYQGTNYITTSNDLTDPAGTHAINGSIIWVDARIDENTLDDFSLKNGTYGSVDEPVIIIVDGNLDLKASPTIYGLLYVRGDVVGGGSGGGIIFGGAVIEGAAGVDGSGGFDVIYEPNVLNNAGRGQDQFRTVGISGTWKDWE